MSQIFHDAINFCARFGACRTGLTGIDCRPQRRFLGDLLRLFLQLLDDCIDVAAGLSQALVEPFVQSLLEDLFPLGERALALAQFRVGLVERAPLSFELDAVALERARLRIET